MHSVWVQNLLASAFKMGEKSCGGKLQPLYQVVLFQAIHALLINAYVCMLIFCKIQVCPFSLFA